MGFSWHLTRCNAFLETEGNAFLQPLTPVKMEAMLVSIEDKKLQSDVETLEATLASLIRTNLHKVSFFHGKACRGTL